MRLFEYKSNAGPMFLQSEKTTAPMAAAIRASLENAGSKSGMTLPEGGLKNLLSKAQTKIEKSAKYPVAGYVRHLAAGLAKDE